MFDFHTEVEQVKAHGDDLRRAAEQRAQIEAAALDQPAPFYAGALVSVGKVLVEVGSRLQAQYAYTEEHARAALDPGAAASEA
jgi:hypothetical protein